MAVPTFYVETSVWGCLAPGQPPGRRQDVQRLLRLLDGARGVCVISTAVTEEVALAPPDEATIIEGEIARVRPVVYGITDEAKILARAYIAAGIVSERRETDAEHVAVATCFGFDYLVSWNHRHMTRPMKKLQYESVNLLKGYPRGPLICNPREACDELRNR